MVRTFTNTRLAVEWHVKPNFDLRCLGHKLFVSIDVDQFTKGLWILYECLFVFVLYYLKTKMMMHLCHFLLQPCGVGEYKMSLVWAWGVKCESAWSDLHLTFAVAVVILTYEILSGSHLRNRR